MVDAPSWAEEEVEPDDSGTLAPSILSAEDVIGFGRSLSQEQTVNEAIWVKVQGFGVACLGSVRVWFSQQQSTLLIGFGLEDYQWQSCGGN